MFVINKLLAVLVSTIAFSAAANATVVTFEESNSLTSNGLTMSNFNRLQCSTYFTQDTGYCRGLASGDWLTFAYGSATVTKTAGGTFTFNGANLTAAWNDNMNIDVIGYRNNVAVYTQTKIVSDDFTTYFTFNYLNIDKLVIKPYGGTDAGTPGGGELAAIDNFTFNQAVPEPGSIALLGLGLAVFAAARRRKAA